MRGKRRVQYTQRVWPRGKPGGRGQYKKGNLSGIAARQRVLTEEGARYIKRAVYLERWLRKNHPKHQWRVRAPRGFHQRLADRLGVSVNIVKKVVKRARWKHIVYRATRKEIHAP